MHVGGGGIAFGIFGDLVFLDNQQVRRLRQNSNNSSGFLLQPLPNTEEQGTTVPLGPKKRTVFLQNNTFVGNNQAHRAGGGSNLILILLMSLTVKFTIIAIYLYLIL